MTEGLEIINQKNDYTELPNYYEGSALVSQSLETTISYVIFPTKMIDIKVIQFVFSPM